ncbi:MAG: AI-2E family transporter [Myxococcota bacterium]
MDRDAQERRIQTACLLILSAVALGFALYWLRPVMVPFVLAVFFALGLAPAVDVQVRALRLPRAVAIVTTLVLGGGLLTGIAALIQISVRQLTANAPAYEARLTELIARTANALPLERIGLDTSRILDALSSIPVSSIGGMLLGTTNAIVDLLSRSLLVLIFMIYLLIGRETRLPGAARRGIWLDIESRIERYIVTKAFVSGATGLLVGGILAVLGIDLALVFGLFAFLLNFIPSVGSVIATLLPLPVVLVSPDTSPLAAALAIALPGLVQFAIGNVLEPKIMGDALDLHPIAILMALILWGMLWGVVGMLLATPITAMMKLLFEQLEATRPVAALLAGRVSGAPRPAARAEPA